VSHRTDLFILIITTLILGLPPLDVENNDYAISRNLDIPSWTRSTM